MVVAARARTVEVFATELFAAVEAAFADASVKPVVDVLSQGAVKCWWLLQALVGRTPGDDVVINEHALAAIRAHLGTTALEVSVVPPEVMGSDGLELMFAAGDKRIGVLLDHLGDAAVSDGIDGIRIEQPPDPNELVAVAEDRLLFKDFAAALELLDRAAAHDGVDPLVHYHRGTALYGLDRFDEALAAFSRAAESLTGSERRSALSNMAIVLAALDRPDESIAAAKRALELDDASDRMHYAIGGSYALRGDRDAAIAHVARAVAISPGLRLALQDDDDFASLRDDVRFTRFYAKPSST